MIGPAFLLAGVKDSEWVRVSALKPQGPEFYSLCSCEMLGMTTAVPEIAAL